MESNKEINERLDKLERKIDLLIDGLGGYDALSNGQNIINDLFGIKTGLDYLSIVFNIAFPEADKKYRIMDEIDKLRMLYE